MIIEDRGFKHPKEWDKPVNVNQVQSSLSFLFYFSNILFFSYQWLYEWIWDEGIGIKWSIKVNQRIMDVYFTLWTSRPSGPREWTWSRHWPFNGSIEKLWKYVLFLCVLLILRLILYILVIFKDFLGKGFDVHGECVRHSTYLTKVSHMTLILNITP